MVSNEQVTDYVLCASCEQRLNDNGERWVMQHCYRPDEGFKIKELIDAAIPFQEDKLKTYSAVTIPGIDVEKLAYFICSILWRGSVHEWRSGRHLVKSPKLGPYEEELRRYLLGETGFPQNAAFWLHIISDCNLWHINLFPYGEKMDNRFFWRYKFIFQGLSFIFFVGRAIDPAILQTCTYRSNNHPIFVSEKMNDMIITDAGNLMRKSKVVGALRKRT